MLLYEKYFVAENCRNLKLSCQKTVNKIMSFNNFDITTVFALPAVVLCNLIFILSRVQSDHCAQNSI